MVHGTCFDQKYCFCDELQLIAICRYDPFGIETECIDCGSSKELLPTGSVGKSQWRVSCSFFYLLHFEWG